MGATPALTLCFNFPPSFLCIIYTGVNHMKTNAWDGYALYVMLQYRFETSKHDTGSILQVFSADKAATAGSCPREGSHQ